METIRRGDRGEHVADVQRRLSVLGFLVDTAETEGHLYGPSTEAAVHEFQQERGLLVDGLVGRETWAELVEAGYALGDRLLYLRRPLFRGDDVRTLQRRLDLLGFDPGRQDGILGDQTAAAVREFQQNVGLRADGIVGPTTLAALDRFLRAPIKGPGRTAVRETEGLRPAGSVSGRRVAIDPGHGPDDPGAVGPTGLTEADAALRLAETLTKDLQARGAQVILLRSAQDHPSDSDRAARANDAGAEVTISLHLNHHHDPAAEGTSTYYFGRLESISVAGQILADLIQDEVSSATGLRDGRTHAKAFPILRETRMPAVQVEPCFITNPKEELLLEEEEFIREVARAVGRGLDRFFVDHGGG